MRGPQDSQNACFSYISLEDRVPQDHPDLTPWIWSRFRVRL
jgi:hypothetical protein